MSLSRMLTVENVSVGAPWSGSEKIHFFMPFFVLSVIRHFHSYQGSNDSTVNDSEGVFNWWSGTDSMCFSQDYILYIMEILLRVKQNA